MNAILMIGGVELDALHLLLVAIIGGLFVYVRHLANGAALQAAASASALATAEQAGALRLEATQREAAARLDGATQALATAQARAESLDQRCRTLEASCNGFRERVAALEARSAEDEKRFAHLAQGVLMQANQHFLQLANETFDKHREGTQGQLRELVKPLGDSLGEFAKRVAEIERVRTEDKSALQQQVASIGESLRQHTAETGRLVSALSAPKGGGRWGEMTLRNVMEQAGLASEVDFTEQVSELSESGRQRPDAIIHLPGGRQIVVDAKVSLDAYLAAHAASDPAEQERLLQAHAQNVQRHVQSLAAKDYQANFAGRLDYVVMFIPGENFFAEALKRAPDLIERAMSRQVIVTTPTTLIALARTVAHLWRQHNMNENAIAAAREGAELYNRIGKVLDHMDKLGQQLNKSVDHYNSMVGSVGRRVMPSLRKFEALKIIPADRVAEDPATVDKRAVGTNHSLELVFDTSEDAGEASLAAE